MELQRARLRELSAPIIEVAEGVLCLPLVGPVDEIGEQIASNVLAAVVDQSARLVIIDVTGIRAIGISTGQWLSRLAMAIGLIGARCTLTGIQPELARLLSMTGLDLSGITALRRVRDAIERA